MKTNSVFSLTVSADDAGSRLDKFLSSLEDISSRNYAKHLIDNGRVLVNGKTVKPSFALSEGQIVEIQFPELQSTELKPYNLKLDIIFEDAHVLVVNKPSGLVVHPAAGHQQDTLVNALLHHTTELSMKNEIRPGIVHRIDKETSGLLVVAKNDVAHEALAQQFKNKTTHRVYYAVLNGQLPKAQGTIRSYLGRHPVDRKRFSSVKENNRIITDADLTLPHAKWAVTHFSKVSQHSNMSYVRLQLETGRTHQIRVHMSELGHPLIGDAVYGFSAKRMKELELTRFFLHAAELGFTHPVTQENLLFKIPWPEADRARLVQWGFEKA